MNVTAHLERMGQAFVLNIDASIALFPDEVHNATPESLQQLGIKLANQLCAQLESTLPTALARKPK